MNDRAILNAYVEVQRASRTAIGGSWELNANDAWIVVCTKAAEAILVTKDKDFTHLKMPDWPVAYVDPAPFLKVPGDS